MEVLLAYLKRGRWKLTEAGREWRKRNACSCIDETTPAYPEMAAVARDADCPVHRGPSHNDDSGLTI